MKNIALFLAAAGLIVTLSGFTARSTTTVEGNWIGEFTELDHSVPFRVHIWQHDGGLKGTITLSSEGHTEMPLTWVMAESTSIHFELVESARTLVFDGVLQNGMITGDLRYSNLRGTFQLAPQNLANLSN